MRAAELRQAAPIGSRPLVLVERDDPVPSAGQVRVRVAACACCRTDLHVVEGDLDLPVLPIVPGHQVVGRRGRGRRRLHRAARRRPGRCAVVASHVRSVRLLPARGGEPVSGRPLHGMDGRRRLRGRGDGTRAVRSAPPRRHRRSRSGAAALRRRDRLPGPAARRGGARRAGRAPRFRRVGAPRDPGAPSLGLRGRRAHAWRCPSRARDGAGRGVGRHHVRATTDGVRSRHRVRTRRRARADSRSSSYVPAAPSRWPAST